MRTVKCPRCESEFPNIPEYVESIAGISQGCAMCMDVRDLREVVTYTVEEIFQAYPEAGGFNEEILDSLYAEKLEKKKRGA